jgi:hypothetical protein
MTATIEQQLAYIRLRQQLCNAKESAWFKLANGETVAVVDNELNVLLSIEKTLLTIQGRDAKILAMADSILHPKQDPLI